MNRASFSLFAVCAPGLEPVVESELAVLGLAGRSEPGGVAFEGRDADLYRASLGLRAATRLLLRLGEFRARTFAELERRSRILPWERLLGARAPVRLRVTCRKSKLYHEGAVAERLLAIISERTGAVAGPTGVVPGPTGVVPVRTGVVPEVAGPGHDTDDAQLVVVRFFRDVCTVSADTSGTPLYMRGYRQALAKAPLRENLAAAMLLAAGWPRDSLLIDPLCGSGTIAIEAALLARGIPPGLASTGNVARRFRFMEWPAFDRAAFDRSVQVSRAGIRATTPAPILGFDRDAGAIRASRANAERAGVAGDIEFDVQPLSLFDPPPTGWLVTNPPYGVRVGDRTHTDVLARDFARLARSRLSGWTLVSLAPDGPMRRALGGDAAMALHTRNGGIPVHLLVRPPLTEAPAQRTAQDP